MSTPDLQLQALTRGLERHFRHVAQTRMVDLPIVNPALAVEAVGFTRTEAGCLGVLITPWFMSLVLLPCEGDDWLDLPIGSEVHHRFASGSYAFQIAGDEHTGRYQTCSLLSPLLEIGDQASAVAVAVAALEALHDPRHRDSASSTHAAEVARRWHGDDETPVDAQDDEPAVLSRRAFISAGLAGGQADTEI